jgi:hypothetical protein
MNTLLLIWSLLLAVPLVDEYRTWGNGRPLRRRRIAMWVTAGFCGWVLSSGIAALLLIALAGLLLLVAQAAVVVLGVIHLHAAWMWLRSRKAVHDD